MSDSDIKQVKCGACKVTLEGRPQSDGEMFYSCPSRGNGDTRDNVLAEVRDYAIEQGARHLQAEFRKSIGTGGIVKFTTNPTPERNYRFIVDLDLHSA